MIAARQQIPGHAWPYLGAKAVSVRLTRSPSYGSQAAIYEAVRTERGVVWRLSAPFGRVSQGSGRLSIERDARDFAERAGLPYLGGLYNGRPVDRDLAGERPWPTRGIKRGPQLVPRRYRRRPR